MLPLGHLFDLVGGGLLRPMSVALARAIVEAQGGSNSVDSRPGEGTRFTMFLPTEAAPDAEQSLPPDVRKTTS